MNESSIVLLVVETEEILTRVGTRVRSVRWSGEEGEDEVEQDDEGVRCGSELTSCSRVHLGWGTRSEGRRRRVAKGALLR